MRLNILFYTLIFLILTGCGTINDNVAYTEGTYVSPTQMSQLTKGSTTESQAASLIGYPDNKEQVGEREVWQYNYIHLGYIPFFKGEKRSETTSLEFEDGILVDAYKSGSASSSNPLLNAAGYKEK